MESFSSLLTNQTLIAALGKENITIPTEIQEKVIPQMLMNKDLVVQSETGTGKTLAYLLPLFQKLNFEIREMQAIILVPTHELAIQVQRQIEFLSQNSEIKLTSTPIIGNVNIDKQIDKLKEKPHIIVGSSGRILELIKKRKITAHTIKTIVVDEADSLMDKNNRENVLSVIKSTLKERQLLFFSASIPKDTIEKAKMIMKDFAIIKATNRIAMPETIEHLFIVADQRDKIDTLKKLIGILQPEKALIFVNQSDQIENVISKIKYHGFDIAGLQGSNRKMDRKQIMDDFRSGKLKLLLATDIAARGLDIEGITHIISMDMPEEHLKYLHRVGRTGRNGNKGVAISLVEAKELPIVNELEREFKIKMKMIDMYKGQIVEKHRR